MKKSVLVIDLLAERSAFGRKGVANMVKYIPDHEVLLWSPHTENRIDYGYGRVVEGICDSDLVIITGSKCSLTEHQDWMNELDQLVREVNTPMIGVCFGHQVVCEGYDQHLKRGYKKAVVEPVTLDGVTKYALFTHEDHVDLDDDLLGDLEIMAKSEEGKIVAVKDSERGIISVQFHPEADEELIAYAVEIGELTEEEAALFEFKDPMWNFGDLLLAIGYIS